jgi:hypothetical protein
MALTPGVAKAEMRQLRLVQELVEMNQGGASDLVEHRTREGYKDQQKRKAFQALQNAGERLSLSDATLTKAAALFAAFRDNREHVQGLPEALAACMIAAVEELEFRKKHEDVLAAAGVVKADPASGGVVPVGSKSLGSAAPTQITPVIVHPVKPTDDPLAKKRADLKALQARKRSKSLKYSGENFLDVEPSEAAEDFSSAYPTRGSALLPALTAQEQQEILKHLEGSETLNPDIDAREEYKAPS